MKVFILLILAIQSALVISVTSTTPPSPGPNSYLEMQPNGDATKVNVKNKCREDKKVKIRV